MFGWVGFFGVQITEPQEEVVKVGFQEGFSKALASLKLTANTHENRPFAPIGKDSNHPFLGAFCLVSGRVMKPATAGCYLFC